MEGEGGQLRLVNGGDMGNGRMTSAYLDKMDAQKVNLIDVAKNGQEL